MSKKAEIDFRFRYIYREPGRCPKCRARLGFQEQAGAMPPHVSCYACGWKNFDHKSPAPDFDLLQSMGDR